MAKTLPVKFLDAKILRSIADAELRTRMRHQLSQEATESP